MGGASALVSRPVIYGYGRVSSQHQELALQREALKRAGVRRVYEEKASGAGVQRPVLEWVLSRMRSGDVLVVWKIDRLSRSLRDLLNILDQLEARGCQLRSLTEAFDSGTPLGRLMVQLLGAFAEWDRSMIRERCAAGKQAALERGVVFGRHRKIDYAAALTLRAKGWPWDRIADRFGVSRGTITSAASRLRNGRASVLDPRRRT